MKNIPQTNLKMALSRLGKFCDQKSNLMDRGLQIFEDKPKEERFEFPVPTQQIELDTPLIFPYFQSLKHEFEAEEKKRNIQQQANQSQTHSKEGFPIKDKQSKGSSLIFKVVNRKPPDYFHKGEKRPYVGLYSPHYVFLQRSCPKWGMSGAEKKSFISEELKKYQTNSSLNQSSGFEKRPSKIPPGSVSFTSQLSRPSITQLSSCNPHESRFDGFNKTPKISTLSNRVSQIDFSKKMGQGPDCFATTMTNLIYAPNFNSKDKKSPKGQVTFDKMPKRNIVFSKKLPYIKDSTNTEKVLNFYQLLHTTPSLTNLSKPKQSRNDTLPRYLTGLHNRMGMTIINSSSLKETNFTNSVYLRGCVDSPSSKKIPSKNKTTNKGCSLNNSISKGNITLHKLHRPFKSKVHSEITNLSQI